MHASSRDSCGIDIEAHGRQEAGASGRGRAAIDRGGERAWVSEAAARTQRGGLGEARGEEQEGGEEEQEEEGGEDLLQRLLRGSGGPGISHVPLWEWATGCVAQDWATHDVIMGGESGYAMCVSQLRH